MRKIGIHLNDQIGPHLEGTGKARAIGRTDPFFARPVKNVDTRVPGDQAVGDIARPVRRVIIDDEDLVLGIDPENDRTDALEVLLLVIGRYDDDLFHGTGSESGPLRLSEAGFGDHRLSQAQFRKGNLAIAKPVQPPPELETNRSAFTA
jgi:hypothetical protein